MYLIFLYFRVHREGLDQLYSISYLLLGVIGLVNSIVSGTIVSFLTGNSFKPFQVRYSPNRNKRSKFSQV